LFILLKGVLFAVVPDASVHDRESEVGSAIITVNCWLTKMSLQMKNGGLMATVFFSLNCRVADID
jgi:hypothetical protein